MPVFPDDWLGEWQGTLEIYSSSGKTMEVPMQCIHSLRGDGSYNWIIIYGSGADADHRNYILRKVNSNAGHYQIDELNGILLDGFVLKDRFISTFEVMDNILQTQYIRHPNGMDFQIVVHGKKPLHETGDTITGVDTIPTINTYRNAVYQIARMKRKPGSKFHINQ